MQLLCLCAMHNSSLPFWAEVNAIKFIAVVQCVSASREICFVSGSLKTSSNCAVQPHVSVTD